MAMKFNGNIDLGDTLTAIRCFRHFGQLSLDSRYGLLHGALHAALAQSMDIPKEDLDGVAYQAGAFLDEFSSELSDHEKWLLGQLKSCTSIAE